VGNFYHGEEKTTSFSEKPERMDLARLLDHAVGDGTAIAEHARGRFATE
jgi:hypothetical protein